ncbi:hypothetical protein ND861_02400 [Leptospira sp. 2 VSF19]|uniref:Uncharacterized protein n=1 Tax=Leptospira soteropolitanensis TaxID=2950025 RepID=A0AAW5V8B5_9LEPT|nr:hypothetical protein [Leptospira soteropolitanensis]MCW7491498.1 hypothetical protein [Leptospira soteropolitanensis]MCW7499082.1 hypothetical protein [Leptospira soteropolitanensis]MCW7521326.1 hypothetical protein [Leptospira soteropolitanensis]MCW7525186.1 hypothetical protein [Leptospira soteropolitanensis]MCW7529053.1 hypothetical protein [Leptospira soteropolitanensis]
MSAITDFFQKIQNQILEIQTTINQIKTSWENFQKFWDLFFTLVPWEVLLLLIFSVILLSIFNSVSPKTPKANLTLAILLLSALWIYFWGLFSKEVSYGRVVLVSLYILFPLHAFGLIQWIYSLGKKIYWKKRRIAPIQWDSALHQLSLDYHQLVGKAHLYHGKIEENRSGLLEEMERLEQSIQGIKSLLLKEQVAGIRNLEEN